MKNFRHPSAERRAKTFWSLNGSLEENELKRQIGILHRMGFGGAYLHSRTGLSTEYLSDEWFRLMNICTDELNALGMKAYLYDEDRYPSGVAGGYVTMHKEFRGKYITVRLVSPALYRAEEDDIAVFSVLFEGQKLLSYSPYRGENQGEKDLLAVFSVREREAQDVYNGYSYFDALKKEATEEFLHVTLDRYASAMGERMGDGAEGVFTDEPNRGAIFNGFAHIGEDAERRVPYTEALFPAYFARWGERLEDVLPELYFRGEETFSRTAWRYTETLTALFIENYALPYEKWCRAHNMVFTGHILHEDNLSAMTTLCGSPMRFYEHMDIPGVDNLTANSTNIAVPVMAASVARQCGKKGVLSEMYAAIGWQADFPTYKRIGDWHAIFGVDNRCTHLSMYTMSGIAKRDFPASILHQSVWWKDYARVEDYFARLGVFLREGKKDVDVLWIHPLESAWGMSRMGGYKNSFVPVDGDYLALETRYWNVSNALAEHGVSFDFGDEEMMGRLAGVVRREGRTWLRIGKMLYPRVLLAGNVTVRSSTLSLLKRFSAAGGEVLLVDCPTHLDGEKRDLSADFEGAARVTEQELPARLAPAYGLKGGRAYVHAAHKGKTLYFAAVSIEKGERTFTFFCEGNRSAERYDPRTGKHFPLQTYFDGARSTIPLTLAAGEEILLVLKENAAPMSAPPAQKTRAGKVFELTTAKYALTRPNVCVLDYCSYECGKSTGQDDVLLADRALREFLRLPQRTPEAIQPWFRKKFGLTRPCGARVTLRFSFGVEVIPHELSLVYERIKGASMRLNGRPVRSSAKQSGWDNCFVRRTLPVSALQKGENVLEVSFRMEEETPVEAMYLTGTFGVRAEGRHVALTRLPEMLTVGDIAPQGLPFYSGELRYRFPLPEGKYTVSLPQIGGALARIGKTTCAFAPLRAELVSDGTAEISVMITQKNKFGPLHYDGDCLGSFGEFCPAPESYAEEFRLVPQGLLRAPLAEREE